MRLADFIETNLEAILLEWDEFARCMHPGKKLDKLTLRDHGADILLDALLQMRPVPNTEKSLGLSDSKVGIIVEIPSEQHAIRRLGSGFDLLQVVSEYQALRASVLRLWHENGAHSHGSDVDDVTRFNVSIDQSLAIAVRSYTNRVDQSRDLFLAILGHDLRNPLNSIALSAALLPLVYKPAPGAVDVVAQITTSTGVMGRMISDLLDYTRTRLGAGMPVLPAPMDLQVLSEELVAEFQSANPSRRLDFESDGHARGDWDSDRLRQAISNLLGNAFQHSPDSAKIELTLHNTPLDIVLTVHNDGPPIAPGELSKIFEPMVRGSSAEHPLANRPGSIGLGLYIARQIAVSHGGQIEVTSTADTGTAFTMRLPRKNNESDLQSVLDEKQLSTM